MKQDLFAGCLFSVALGEMSCGRGSISAISCGRSPLLDGRWWQQTTTQTRFDHFDPPVAIHGAIAAAMQSFDPSPIDDTGLELLPVLLSANPGNGARREIGSGKSGVWNATDQRQ